METENRELFALITVLLLLLLQRSSLDLAMQLILLRRLRRRRAHFRFMNSLRLMYIFCRAHHVLPARQPRRAWAFPRPQNWFQQLLNDRALDML